MSVLFLLLAAAMSAQSGKSSVGESPPSEVAVTKVGPASERDGFASGLSGGLNGSVRGFGRSFAEATDLPDLLPPEPKSAAGKSIGPAFAPSSDSRDLRWLLVSQNAQRAVWQGMLGARRVRQLERARFEMDLVELHPDREMREDEDYFRDMRDNVGRSFGKVLRERLERRLNLDRALGRSNNADDGSSVRAGWKLSPRVDVGSRNRLGVKFAFRDGDQSWRSRLSLQMSHDFEEDLYMKLVFNGRRAEAEVRYVADDNEFGQSITADVRFALGSKRFR